MPEWLPWNFPLVIVVAGEQLIVRGVYVKEDAIRALRLARGLTQEALASRADIDVTTVRKLEKGNRAFDVQTVLAIASALNCEFSALIAPLPLDIDRRERHLDIVHQWHAAYADSDCETLLPLHTHDTTLEIHAAEDLPAVGNFYGIEQLRGHFVELFQLFRLRSVREDDFDIHAAENLVFSRATAKIEYLPTGKSYETRHLHEFEFRDGLIARRSVIADYSKLRGAIQ